MSRKKSAFIAGVRDSSPLLVGVIPFGLICGAVFVDLGMPEWKASAMSVIVFAGASQLVAAQLMAENATMVVVVMTCLVINARMLMYSASLAPHFNGLNPAKKAGLAYLLTDQAYAMSITRFSRSDGDEVDKPVYYLGSAMLMWTAFNSSTLVGAYLGAFIPAGWNLDFAIPLTFIALVVPAIKDRPAMLAALVAGGVAFLADPLPYNLGLMVAAAFGIVAGYQSERRLGDD